MRWRRRKPPEVPEAPRGVRILHGDGLVSECSIVRTPELDDDLTAWMIVPPVGVKFDAGLGDAIKVDALPGRTMVYVSPAHVWHGQEGGAECLL